MTVKLAQFIKPVVKNGVGSFVLPVSSLHFCLVCSQERFLTPTVL